MEEILDHRDGSSSWRSILQTPHEASIPISAVRWLVEKELIGQGILEDLGISDQDDCSRKSFKANFSRGWWEVTLYTGELLTVPEHLRPTTTERRKKPGDCPE